MSQKHSQSNSNEVSSQTCHSFTGFSALFRSLRAPPILSTRDRDSVCLCLAFFGFVGTEISISFIPSALLSLCASHTSLLICNYRICLCADAICSLDLSTSFYNTRLLSHCLGRCTAACDLTQCRKQQCRALLTHNSIFAFAPLSLVQSTSAGSKFPKSPVSATGELV